MSKKHLDDVNCPIKQFSLTSKYELHLGQLVKSLTGRDKDNYYLIIGFEKNLLILADGRRRSVSFPKKKNIRHVQKCNLIAADQGHLAQGKNLTDEDIRALIKQLKPES